MNIFSTVLEFLSRVVADERMKSIFNRTLEKHLAVSIIQQQS